MLAVEYQIPRRRRRPRLQYRRDLIREPQKAKWLVDMPRLGFRARRYCQG